MRYVRDIDFNIVKLKYDHVIAWGTGPLFRMNSRQDSYRPEFVVDGTGKMTGQFCKGVLVKDVSALDNMKGKILIVIYVIYEIEIMQQIKIYDKGNIDTVVYPLLNLRLPSMNFLANICAKSSEDYLLIMLLRQLEIKNIEFLEIGVCHPIIRNNTYLINRQMFTGKEQYRGVLVEANPLWWNLIEEYRPEDRLLRCGIGIENGMADFYMFPDLLGHSTFVKKIAEQKITCGRHAEVMSIEILKLEDIVMNNFDRVPDLFAMDVEGMDLEVLQTWNHERFPFKIVVTEMKEENKSEILDLMHGKGYKIYATTVENVIWVDAKYSLAI